MAMQWQRFKVNNALHSFVFFLTFLKAASGYRVQCHKMAFPVSYVTAQSYLYFWERKIWWQLSSSSLWKAVFQEQGYHGCVALTLERGTQQ